MSTTTPATGAAPSVIATAHPPTIPAEQECSSAIFRRTHARAWPATILTARSFVSSAQAWCSRSACCPPSPSRTRPVPKPRSSSHGASAVRRRRWAQLHVQAYGEEVVLGVEADFSVYVQKYPDRAEQTAARGVATAAADADDDSPPNGDATTAPASAPAPSSGSSDLAEVWRLTHLHRPAGHAPGHEHGRARLAQHPAERQGPRHSRPGLRGLEDRVSVQRHAAVPNAATDSSDADYWAAIRAQEGDAHTRPLSAPDVKSVRTGARCLTGR